MKTPSMLHWQLTLRCDLACSFCGQARKAPGDELAMADWRRLADEAATFSPRPRVTLWGGEPLLHPDFSSIANHALACGLTLDLITNGTRLAMHAGLLRRFATLYVSVDGPEAVHDAVRGRGVFARVREGLRAVGPGGPERVLMTALASETLERAEEAPFGLPVERVIFHELIRLAPHEAPEAPQAEAWRANYAPDYPTRLKEALARWRGMSFPAPVEFQPHFAGGGCREPERHLHVGATGETGFCTDFTGYTLGNVRERTQADVFHSEAACRWRDRIARGGWPYCAHCSWKNTERTIIRFMRTHPALEAGRRFAGGAIGGDEREPAMQLR